MVLSSLPGWARTAGFRSRKAGSDRPGRRFSEAVLGGGERFSRTALLGKILRWRTLVALLLLLVVLLLPFANFPGVNRAVLDDGNNVANPAAFKGLLSLFYNDTDSGEDLPLQNVEKEDTLGQGSTRNTESDELQITNTTSFDQQENQYREQPIGISRKVNPENHHTADVQVRNLKDQLAIAKVYLEVYPTQSHHQFIGELHERVTDVESMLQEATTDSELPDNASERLKAMEETLSKGKQIIDACISTEKSLRASLRSTEGQLQAEKKQRQFIFQHMAKTLPKGLHCLPLKLSIEYYSLNSTQKNRFPHQEKLEDPNLYHYALFSDNVLAAAVVVNSTLCHAKNPEDHVFHVITDELNCAAMKMWFLSNPPGKATIQVQKVEEFTWLNSSYSPVLKQLESTSMISYYFRTQGAKSDGNLKFRNPKYLSILNHLRFYLPEIFPKLNKVVFLDDDVVVQKDLTGLWGIDLEGMVNGAVETCREKFHRFDKYLNFSNPLIAKNFDPNACGWAYGMNVFDLVEWRKQNCTDLYHSWQKLNHDRQLWKLGSLPPGLITFYNRTLPLNRSWHVLGLGYDEQVKEEDIDHAAVIHYNGNQKPWLDIGMAKYRKYWSKFVNYDQTYLRRCNILP